MQLRSAILGALILIAGMVAAEQAAIPSGVSGEQEETLTVYADYVLETLGLR